MARTRSDQSQTLLPSLLDRLVDHERRVTFLHFQTDRSKIIEHLQRAVRENLEWLLNTRQRVDSSELLDKCEELKTSVWMFGLPDLTSRAIGPDKARKMLAEKIEEAIRRYEPRLVDVKVYPGELMEVERRAAFQISAKLLVEPAPEPIAYVTTLELGNHIFEVRPSIVE